jgi:hypothetical protein
MEMIWVYNIFCGNLQVHVSNSKPNYMLFEVCTLKFSDHVMRLWSLEEEQPSRWWRWWWWWCGGTQLHYSRSFTTSAISCYKSHCVRDIEKNIGSSPSVACVGPLLLYLSVATCETFLIMCRDKTQNKSSSIAPQQGYLHKVQENLNLLP